MEYLILRQFRSFGEILEKGSVVDASRIRFPKPRISEGSIIPAVSSAVVSGVFSANPTDSPDIMVGNVNISNPAPIKLHLAGV